VTVGTIKISRFQDFKISRLQDFERDLPGLVRIMTSLFFLHFKYPPKWLTWFKNGDAKGLHGVQNGVEMVLKPASFPPLPRCYMSIYGDN